MNAAESDSQVQRITSFVAAETGLCFRTGSADIEAGIRRAMAGSKVTDLHQFAELLESRQLPIDELVDVLTVGESYFFREPHHFDFIRQEVFSDVLARRGPGHALRIWSAGCSSGEEAYSLAITLIDAGLEGHVLATDLSRRALQRARTATYRRWSLRGLDDALIRRCFHETGNLWTLDKRFRVPVTFEFQNLARGVHPSIPAGIWGMDLILCRNVLIYLDADTIRRVAHRLSETLAEDGWLITGPSDPMLEGVASLSPIVTPHGIVYRRKAQRTGPTPPHTPDDIRVSSASSDVAAVEAPVTLQLRDPNAFPSAIVAGEPGKDPNDRGSLREAQAAFAAGEYRRVLDLTRRVGDEASAALRILAFANRDGSEVALEELDRFVERFPLSTELHLLRATLRIDLAYHLEAIQSLRHVLYLDRSLIIAHFMLATAFRRQGRLHEARRAYRNARDLAIARDPDERLPLADGERARAISDAATAELALLDARQAEAS